MAAVSLSAALCDVFMLQSKVKQRRNNLLRTDANGWLHGTRLFLSRLIANPDLRHRGGNRSVLPHAGKFFLFLKGFCCCSQLIIFARNVFLFVIIKQKLQACVIPILSRVVRVRVGEESIEISSSKIVLYHGDVPGITIGDPERTW